MDFHEIKTKMIAKQFSTDLSKFHKNQRPQSCEKMHPLAFTIFQLNSVKISQIPTKVV